MNLEEALQRTNELGNELLATSDRVDRAKRATELSAFVHKVLMPALTADRQIVIRLLREEGLSMAAIGELLGVGMQRVFQLLDSK